MAAQASATQRIRCDIKIGLLGGRAVGVGTRWSSGASIHHVDALFASQGIEVRSGAFAEDR
jgi:hypothetical protein